MLNNLFEIRRHKNSANGKRSIFVHHIVAFPVIILLALMVAIFSVNIVTLENSTDTSIMLSMGPIEAHAQEPPKFLRNFTSVDVMKLTKDVVRNQPSPDNINALIETLSQTHARYIAISIPLDASADYPGAKPSPQTAENFTKTWADAIHAHNMLVLWRGTWSGMEGIYDFPKRVGQNRFPAGNWQSAATDGNTTWLGKTYAYIVDHPDLFKSGDIWAPLPERTENIFQDQTSFLPYTGGIQANYANFFNDLKKTSDLAFLKIDKKVYTGWTSNNFSEVNSGWMYSSVFSTAGITAVDHYGTTHTPEEMEISILAAYRKTHQQVFLQEWSDYWNGKLADPQRQLYLDSMYTTFQKLADQGILMGFNYWGGWPGGIGESIVDKTPTGYQLNARGLRLTTFFLQNTVNP